MTTSAELAISTRALSLDYTLHRQRAGLSGALRGLVRRRRETRRALDSLDLDVHRGELIGLLGRNGAGKTTTVKLCCGLLRPTSGRLEVLGHEPGRRAYAFLRRIAVVLGQKSMLWWDVSPLDSYLVHQAMYEIEQATFRRRLGELSELLDLSALLDVPVRKLSLGERMKAELVGALLHGPEVIFLDEPTIGLDVVSRLAVRDFLRTVNAQHETTIVLTSHDMGDVEALCRRVVLVEDGRVGFDGSLDALVRAAAPARRVAVTYAAVPVVPDRLPDGVRVSGLTGTRLELEVQREAVTSALQAAPVWGAMTDLDVAEADLEDVMATVLSGRPEQSGGAA